MTNQIHGHIERITFHNPDTGYTVAQLMEVGKKHLTCIVGIMPALQPGETVRCFGSWKQHLIHGRQFEVESCKPEVPATVAGIQKYLGSGLIRGIGPTFAKRIVDKFGLETLDIIEYHADRLLQIEGLGKKKLDKIKTCWLDQKAIRDVMIFLQSHKVSPSYAQKIFREYGSKCIEIVQANPYKLARDIRGIGFKSADKIASALGIAKEAPQRLDAGIEHTLMELADDGHVCYPLDELLIEAEKLLENSQDAIKERVNALQQEGRIELFETVSEGKLAPFAWLKWLFVSEVGIAREIQRLTKAQSNLRAIDTIKALDWVQKELVIELATNQQQAVATALTEKLEIITGGPGTGKSTITNAILAITSKLTQNILLAAPTGRAAKRMTEITGWKAQTIHSLLEFNFKDGGFKRNRQKPLECDLLIVDEASMIDTSLMYSLLKAVPTTARVIFVGDINQLPSVGPGNVLRDMIASNQLPTVMLNEIFRQAAGSRIITNSHRINNGVFPDLTPDAKSDFFFLEAEEPQDVTTVILGLVSQRLPKTYGFDPIKDIQVLAPMKKGVVGTENLNTQLQQVLNKREDVVFKNGMQYGVGDKVMQLRNDYDKHVFNGDVGQVSSIQQSDQQLAIDFDGREVIYDFNDLDDVSLAYAVSIHKYQGSECPCVIIPVHTTHFMMLHRNLLYTGVTRGKKLVVLVGTKKALSIAVRNDEVKRRYTGLQQALIGVNVPALV